MPLNFRLAAESDHPRLEQLFLSSFEPVTWFRRADAVFGPLNGLDWRERWRLRLAHIFRTQILLVGEAAGEIVAAATATLDSAARLAYIDLLAVDPRRQGEGYGREMLRGMLQHLKERGAEHAHLDCLTTNKAANRLYQSEGFTEVARHIRWMIRIP